MTLLQVLINFNDNLSFRAKQININNVLASLNELKNILHLLHDAHPSPYSNFPNDEFVLIKENRYCFNYCLFSYVDNFDRITDDKKERADIKAICIKISEKYRKYFARYNKTNQA